MIPIGKSTWAKVLLLYTAMFCVSIAWSQRLDTLPTVEQVNTVYADLLVKSAALTVEQKAKAQQLFATGFGLWQSGNFEAAAKAFQDGLAIDPQTRVLTIMRAIAYGVPTIAKRLQNC